MSEPYIGEIRMFGGNYAPYGWMMCHGQLLAISEYEALFNLIGTTYGGDGQSTFALPDLQGRLPMHQGPSNVIGEMAGTETVTLTTPQSAAHSHQFLGSSDPGGQADPAGNVPATIVAGSAYVQQPPSTSMAPGSIQATTGGNQPHSNMQPYLCVSFIIAMAGVFPSQG